MKILADTNIIFSALLFPKSKPSAALLHAAKYHSLVLCDYIVDETRRIINAKAPALLPDFEVLLAELCYELVPAPTHPQKLIDDPKDAPILNAAILAGVDIIISGDKHFLSAGLKEPKVMTAAGYLEFTKEA